jgi:dihydroorotate dehydrogenase (fumarate)
MANLRTKYMGLELKNPIIVGANNLVTDSENLKMIEKSGAAAVVYKSLFEEQIQLENLEHSEQKAEYTDRNAEMVTLFPSGSENEAYPLRHLSNLKKAKETVSIPVFASLNAIADNTWVEFAIELEKTGVDGLELNFYTTPEKFEKIAGEVETRQLETFKKVKSALKIPVSVKLSPFYSNPLKLVSELDTAGADGIVLFNRLFQPDIDINSEELTSPYSLSNSEDNRLPLRFAGLLYKNIKASICTNSGIFTGHDVVKMILSGSDCVQVVSTLYLNQISVIESMLEEIEKWMDSKGYGTIDSFRGKLSKKRIEDPRAFHSAQYIDFQSSTTAILKKYKVIN